MGVAGEVLAEALGERQSRSWLSDVDHGEKGIGCRRDGAARAGPECSLRGGTRGQPSKENA